MVEIASEYLRKRVTFLVFIFPPCFPVVFVTLTITVLWSQDCQCSIYLYPRKSRKPRKPWFTLHRKITQHYRMTFTQTQSLEKAWQMLLAEYLPSLYILSCFKKFGEIIQFSQLLIQELVDHFADFWGFSLFLPVDCLLAFLPEGKKEK